MGSLEKNMLNARRPCFYTFYSSTLSSERLKIPVRFVRNMEQKTSGIVSLMGPSGRTWHVDLIQQNDDLYLTHGWPTFVRDHFLQCGDFLVFTYDCELHFIVQVFDQSTCEKEAAFHSQCTQDLTTVNKIVEFKRSREGSGSPSDTITESMTKKMRSISEVHSECNEKNQESRMIMQGETLDSRVTEMYTKGDILNRTIIEEDFNMQDKVCLSMLSSHDEKTVAQSFTSHFPYFVRIMKSFNISGSYTLNIPYKFSMAHLPNCKIKIVLHNSKGEYWTVNSVPATRVHTSHTLCGGWMAFVRGNDIKIGDICIYELVRECELRVQIISVGKQQFDSQSGKGTSNRVGSGRAVISHRTFKSLPKKMTGNSLKVHPRSARKVEVSERKGLGKTRKPPKASSKSVVLRRKSVKDDLELQARHGLRLMLAHDEERAARSFTSCFPTFVRIMKGFNVSGSYTLKIPHQFSTTHLPNFKTEIVLRNLSGKCWTVNSVPDSNGRMIHTFCGGWMAFVRDNDVKIGDTCIFELIGECEIRVHISEVGKKRFDQGSGEEMCNELAIVPSVNNHPSL